MRSVDTELDNAILRNLLAHTTRAYEEQVAALSREKDFAQITLASIGDGVITADIERRITYLNPVAGDLTGWLADEALGEPLEAVFRLVKEASGEAVELPFGRVLEGVDHPLAERPLMLVRRDGQRFAVEPSVAPIRGGDGKVVGLVIVFQDVTDQRLLSLQLAHQATHDALTGLLNRQAFDQYLRHALDSAREGESHSLCYIDLDQFKLVNDTCGHLAGDELLRRITAILLDEVRETDLVARLGGDEFGVLLAGCHLDAARRIARRIHRALQTYRFVWQDRTFSVGASFGLVPLTPAIENLAQLLSAADHACYLAKDRGRNRIEVYRTDDADLVRRTAEMNWVLRLQETLEEDRFELYAQVIEPLDGGPTGLVTDERPLLFEILVRMVDRDGRILAPSSFIRAAERYGLTRELDRWVVSHTLEALAAESPQRLARLHTCSINLSAVSMGDEGFLEFVHQTIAQYGVAPEKLCFEVTETAAVANLVQAQRLVDELEALGCRFALDDFGIGMASYAKLKALKVNYLKIDRTFIRDLVTNSLDRAMVESIHQMAAALEIQTIAEGVSNGALLDRLRELGVHYAQGHWLARPRPLAEVLARADG